MVAMEMLLVLVKAALVAILIAMVVILVIVLALVQAAQLVQIMLAVQG